MERRHMQSRTDRLRAALTRAVCVVVGHRYPLQPKHDGGRRPWLCPRCRYIVSWGENPPRRPPVWHRSWLTARWLLWGALGLQTTLGVSLFGWWLLVFAVMFVGGGYVQGWLTFARVFR